jgi:hypothetical protein
MTTLAQARYLRIYDADTTHHRWQSYHVGPAVTWDAEEWDWMPFEAGGITAGLTGDESGVTIVLPALPVPVAALHAAMADGHLLELRIYQFDPTDGDSSPLVGQALIGAFIGKVVNASATLTELKWELGSSLSPVGAQIPPRTMTTRLIGKGCRL